MTKTERVEQGGLATQPRPSRWWSLAIASSAVIGLWSVALQLLAGELIPPVAIMGVVFGLFAGLLTTRRRWVGLVVSVLALLALAGNLPLTVDELSHPSSAPAFLLTLVVSTAAIVLVISGVAAFRAWTDRPSSSILKGWGVVAIAGVLLAMVAASGVESVGPTPGDVEVIAEGVEFSESAIVVSAGEVGIWVDNRDGIRHTFSIRESGQSMEVPSFSAQRADFSLEPGTYSVFCAVPGHENMTIDLVVEG